MPSHAYGNKTFGLITDMFTNPLQKRRLLWIGFVALVVCIEAALHDPPGNAIHYTAILPGLALLCAIAIFLFHYNFVVLNPRTTKGTLLLAAIALASSWLSSMQFGLCLEILFLIYILRVLYGSLFSLSRMLAFIAVAYFSFDAISSERHNIWEVLLTWLAAEITLRLVTVFEKTRNGPRATKSLRFELRNILNVALGGSRAFWEESFSSGQWSFLESPEQSLRHIQIAGLVTRATQVSLLDVGCGLGTLFNYLPQDRVDYCGLDISVSVTEQNRVRFSEHSNAIFVASGLLDYRPPGQKYDVIVLNEVLYYLPITHLKMAIRHCASLLRADNSTLVISMNKNPKAILIWELLGICFPAETSSAVENSQTGSKWYIRTYRRRDLI